MDRLLVATLNILNLADRWDGAAAAPAGRHGGAPAGPDRPPGGRLPDAAGPAARGGRRGPLRGGPWLGRAGRSTATACSSRRHWSATDVERLDLGARPVGAPRAAGAARRVRPSPSRSPTSTTPRRARRATRAGGGAAAVAGRVARARRADRRRRLQRRPARAGVRVHARRRLPVGVRRGERRGAGRDLAERPAGRGDGHRRRARLPRLHLAARRRRRRRGAPGSCSTGRRPATRRCTRRTTWASPRRCGSDERRAVAKPMLRLAHRGDWRLRAGEHARGADPRGGHRRHATAWSSTSGWAATASRSCSTTRRWPASRAARGRVGPVGGGARAAGDPDARGRCSRRSRRTRRWTSSSRATTTPTPRRPSCAPAGARHRHARGLVVRRRRRSQAMADRLPSLGPLAQRRPTSGPDTLATAKGLGCRAVAVLWGAITPASLRRRTAAGLEVAAWTVRRPATFERLERQGVVACCVEGRAFDG